MYEFRRGYARIGTYPPIWTQMDGGLGPMHLTANLTSEIHGPSGEFDHLIILTHPHPCQFSQGALTIRNYFCAIDVHHCFLLNIVDVTGEAIIRSKSNVKKGFYSGIAIMSLSSPSFVDTL